MNLDFERCAGCMYWVPFHKNLGSLGYCILNDHEYELGVIPVGKMAQCPRREAGDDDHTASDSEGIRKRLRKQ